MKVGNKAFLPVLALIISTIGVASAIAFVKLSEVDATSTLMLRMFMAGGMASALAAWPAGKNTETGAVGTARSRRAMLWLLVLSGVVSCVDLLSNHWAVKLTSMANTSVLMNLSPVFVALLSYLFMKEKIGVYQVLALTLSIGGACLLVFDGSASVAFSSQSVTGDLLALNSALFYAIYLILIKSLRDCFTSRKIIIWNSFTCAVLLLPIALLTSAKILPDTVQGWVVIALLALISQLLGHGLMAYALRHVDVVLASVSALARPVVAILIGFFFFDEQLTLVQWLGVAAVLVGVWWYKRPVPVVRPVVQAKTPSEA
ncbi:EamA family transporter [Pseudomonas syringae]|uniref:EamA family transporter n=3 Tax=Pseudomonas syringae TaxID=317 RepID=A0A6B2B2B4_PSESX|nr:MULTISPECIES: EamA family transporter [Pseudomonas]AKF50228.1 Permeases of the drug/metabolite transporter(DMT) superfamily [Pseudomonas syringae pv. syringae HS191]MBI6560118.1 EamA family transporter [Pseudomonas syringae]MBI6572866.1 EamA family transporter [Pseudomonas syringae]MBI6587224.1 EamA family transporter [Pseudomonas syringae]MBI6592663.1 EamA family transporter [Pseudomonas syringae]